MFMAQRNATIPSGLTCGASMFTIRRRRYTLQRLLAIFGELDTTEGVKANVSAIRQILDQAGRRDYTVKVYPNRSHNLMEVPPDNPNEFVRLKRFPPGMFEMIVDWTTTQVRRRVPTRR